MRRKIQLRINCLIYITTVKKEKTLWDMQDQHLDELTEEVFAEELRLLYVALTRAKYQMAFVLPKVFDKKMECFIVCFNAR